MDKKYKNPIRYLSLACLCLGSVVGVTAQTETGPAAESKTLDMIFKKVDPKNYNGSVYTISGEQIRNVPITSLNNTLVGLIPGLYSRQMGGGMADGSAQLTIRGERSNNTVVLILVDGVERELSFLAPQEVESITVLKDAAATALYGLRASGGAILVQTRKGKDGPPRVEATAQWISMRPLGMLEPVGSSQYAAQYAAAARNDTESNIVYSAHDIWAYGNDNSEEYPNTQWLKENFRSNSWAQRYNVSVEGGVPLAQYFVDAGLTRQNGMFNIGDDYSYNINNTVDRYNLRSNVQFALTKTTQIGLDLYGWTQKDNHPGFGAYEVMYAMARVPSVYSAWYADKGYTDQDGARVTAIDGMLPAYLGADLSNPWASLNRTGYTTLNQIFGAYRLTVDQDLSAITPGLKASGTLAMDAYSTYILSRSKTYASYTPGEGSTIFRTGDDGAMTNTVANKNSYRRTNIVAQLSWDRYFGDHNLSALAFYEQMEHSIEVNIPERRMNIGGWAAYNYANRYSVDLLLSHMGSYKFAPGKKWGFFPTVAAGWTVSNESFFENAKEFMPYLRLKASYGMVGNDRAVDDFFYRPRIANLPGSFVSGTAMGTNNAGRMEEIVVNQDLTWEKSKMLNIALESRLFAGKLFLSAEYFRDQRTDMYVLNRAITSLFGTPLNVSSNVGAMYTRGVDLAAVWSDASGDFSYSVGGMLSVARNKVTAFGQAKQPYPWMEQSGYPISSKKGLVAEGLFSSWEEIASAPRHTYSQVQPGDIKYRDINGDGIIDDNDITHIGYSGMPQIIYGINLNFSYKGIGVAALFQGAAKVSTSVGGPVAYPFETANSNIYSHQLNYWTPEKGTGDMPRLSLEHNATLNNSRDSSYWLQDASYLRLKTLEISYSLSESLFERSFVRGIKVFASGYNLVTWTKAPWTDPEASPTFAMMPVTRNISFGCSIKF